MATILFAAAGAALGAGFGGTVLGLSGAVIGRAIGATLGRMVDQRIMGLGAEPVEVGRLDRLHVMGASEGAPIARCWGRVRLPGQVIWTSPFHESASRSGGGKGGSPRVTQYSYSVSLALALCEGEILGIGRIWADGDEIPAQRLNLRLYHGSETQLPDALIEAHVGAGLAPAYRGIAYVVVENLDLTPHGSRVPQLSFEVIRRAQGDFAGRLTDLQEVVRAVALVPGTGEYALSTRRVGLANDWESSFQVAPVTANVNTPAEVPDLLVSLAHLRRELPQCGAVSLIVSWFGSDLRCGHTAVRPKVEQKERDGVVAPWRAGGIVRAAAETVPRTGGRPIYGGTPDDSSVIDAIRAVRAGGQSVMFYPFILMDQMEGNSLPDPYSDTSTQAVLPWRGRITTSVAPGRPGSPDKTAAAVAEVAAFFGAALPGHFSVVDGEVSYSGPAGWGYRRFILHYAHLCAAAGGVDAFCIGSEMRGLTQIRGPEHSFPAVVELRRLAADVRAILGPGAKISYAADWSEYFGYHAEGNVYFHLDPLWSDDNIDFIGIDNYMPLSDWRDGEDHADAGWGSVNNLAYLGANVCGGEGFDWYYDGPEGEAQQRRIPIIDTEHGEHWVFRNKDLRGWWENLHHDRIDGLRLGMPTGWIPGSKPIRFTEYGCAAIDKGTNAPNRFLDPKSSESALPRASSGARDDFIQMQYYRAIHAYWSAPENNPVLSGNLRMVDLAHCYAWAWDARPFPEFPRNEALWSDGANFYRGHWLNGRATSQPLDRVVADLCDAAGLPQVDTSGLYGLTQGYTVADTMTARAYLQPLTTVYGFDCVEAGGGLTFRTRGTEAVLDIDIEGVALTPEGDNSVELVRAPAAETVGRIRFGHVEAEGGFKAAVAEVLNPHSHFPATSESEYSVVMTNGQAKAVAARWLAEAGLGQDVLKLRLPPSASGVSVGSILGLGVQRFRVDRVELDEARTVEAMRIEPAIYAERETEEAPRAWTPYRAAGPLVAHWLDLPLLRGTEEPHAPRVAVVAEPWGGAVALWSADTDADYVPNIVIPHGAVIGMTLNDLPGARSGVIDRGPVLLVRFVGGGMSSCGITALLNGANAVAIGDGNPDSWEVVQVLNAELVAPDTYALSGRLRGQAGTDAMTPDIWPEGSHVVVLGEGVPQISLPPVLRGTTRHYRLGLADRGLDDEMAIHTVQAFSGNGLRPYAVCHMRCTVIGAGAHRIGWIRRARLNGDGWDGAEVPLGEDSEAYTLRILDDAMQTVRSLEVAQPTFEYTTAMRNADGTLGGYTVEVRQLSSVFGPGPVRRLTVG